MGSDDIGARLSHGLHGLSSSWGAVRQEDGRICREGPTLLLRDEGLSSSLSRIPAPRSRVSSTE